MGRGVYGMESFAYKTNSLNSLDILACSILASTAFAQDLHDRGGLPGFVVAIVLLGLGVGATKPNLLAFLGTYVRTEYYPSYATKLESVTLFVLFERGMRGTDCSRADVDTWCT